MEGGRKGGRGQSEWQAVALSSTGAAPEQEVTRQATVLLLTASEVPSMQPQRDDMQWKQCHATLAHLLFLSAVFFSRRAALLDGATLDATHALSSLERLVLPAVRPAPLSAAAAITSEAAAGVTASPAGRHLQRTAGWECIGHQSQQAVHGV